MGGATGSIPVVVSPGKGWLVDWIGESAVDVAELLHEHHAVLFRGFRGVDADRLGAVAHLLGGETLGYRSGVSPRKKLSEDVYTSTEFSGDLKLPLHNELSYGARWPGRIFFACLEPAARGGETPIADVRSVYSSIDQEIRSDFERRGVIYLQNYGTEASDLNVSWMQAFETDDPKIVEEHCKGSGTEVEWRGDGGLRTKRWAPAIRVHPVTSEPLWFNQAHSFHSSALDRRVRRGMLARFGPEGLPRNALYGDGSTVPHETMMKVHQAFDRNTIMFDWQRDDVLILDNMIFGHGRMPFSGSRRVLVAMSDPMHEEELQD